MSGRHLRRGPGSAVRGLLVGLAVLLVGAALGAGGSLLVEDRPGDGPVDDAATGSAVLDPEPGPITIALVGDVTDGAALGGRLAAVLRDADLAIANVDAAIAADAAGTGGVGVASPEVLDALSGAGVDVASVANDRALDLGAEALLEVVGAATGAVLIGAGVDEDAAYAPLVRDVGGHTVAVLAATQVLDPDRIRTDTAGPGQPGVASAKRVDRLVGEVEAARAVADTVVVYVHWGDPGETCPSVSQQELAAALVAAGADVVAGPGSGRVQGAGRTGGAAVAYGLGRSVVDDPAESGALLVEVDGREVLGLEWLPAAPDGGAAVAEWERRRGCTDLTP